MNLFGLTITGKSKESKKQGEAFAPPRIDDGAIEIESDAGGTSFASSLGYHFDIDNIPSDEFELISTYRDLSIQPDIDEAIQEIVNEAIITDEFKQAVSVVLDDVDVSESIKTKIRDEFEYILKLLKFRTDGYGLFRKWYVDGKLFVHKVVDKNHTKNGITELINIDPLNIKLVRELKKKREGQIELYDLAKTEEYYMYSQSPFSANKSTSSAAASHTTTALRVHKDSIAYVPSGLVSSDAKTVLSYLYKCIKPYNNLVMLEDSVVVYRVSRAPERRIFYVDVGNLPKGKAEQYLKDVINRFKNKIVYDVAKGTVTSRKKFQSMMEDYWLPRREGARGTEVSTLPGAENLGELSDVEYFKTKLYKSLNVPLSRFQQDGSSFNIGRTSEITRDEIKFSKFISRLRSKFSTLFNDLLKTQLILKNIIDEDDWNEWGDLISYDFLEDNYFQELKESEILRERLETLELIQRTEITGRYISHEYVRTQILRQTEDEIKEEDKRIDKEKKDKRWEVDPEHDMSFGAGGGDAGGYGGPMAEPKPQPVVVVDDDEPKEKPINKEKSKPSNGDK